VSNVRRKPVVLAAAVVGALAALWLRARRRSPSWMEPPAPDPRAEDLRRRLAEARAAAPDVLPTPPDSPRASVSDAPPQDEFEAMRRRVHEEARAAAEEMRRRSGEGAG
jgi:hypothetical protein